MTTIANIKPLCKARLIGDFRLLKKEPCEYIYAIPDKDNMLLWYFLIKGPPDTDYVGGWYLGKIMHDPDYPNKPPNYMMLTPNGRFNIGGNICMTNTGYHASDWSPLWNIITMLQGFLSIMTSDKDSGVNHIKRTKKERKIYADASVEYNKQKYFEIITRFTQVIDANGNPIKKDEIPSSIAATSSGKTVVKEVIEEEVYIDPEVIKYLDAVQLEQLKASLREENKNKHIQEQLLIQNLEKKEVTVEPVVEAVTVTVDAVTVYIDPEVIKYLDAVQLEQLKASLREENKNKHIQEQLLIQNLEKKEVTVEPITVEAVTVEAVTVDAVTKPVRKPRAKKVVVEEVVVEVAKPVRKPRAKKIVEKVVVEEVVAKPVRKPRAKKIVEGEVVGEVVAVEKPKRGRPKKVAAN